MLPQLAAQYPGLFDEELETRVAELEAKRKGKVGDRKRADLLNNICEDSVRQLAGVADDFPWMDDLIDKKNLGLDPGVGGKMAMSNRTSFMERLQNPRALNERPEEPENPNWRLVRGNERPEQRRDLGRSQYKVVHDSLSLSRSLSLPSHYLQRMPNYIQVSSVDV
jgi:hypothetical protein